MCICQWQPTGNITQKELLNSLFINWCSWVCTRKGENKPLKIKNVSDLLSHQHNLKMLHKNFRSTKDMDMNVNYLHHRNVTYVSIARFKKPSQNTKFWKVKKAEQEYDDDDISNNACHCVACRRTWWRHFPMHINLKSEYLSIVKTRTL